MARKSSARFTSLRGFARERKVTTATAQRWRDQGFLVYGDDGRIDIEASSKRLDARPEVYRGGRVGGNPPKSNGGRSRPRSRVSEHIERKEAALATLREIEVRRQLNELVLVEDVSKIFVRALTLIRARMLSLPVRVAPELLNLRRPAQAERIVREGVVEILTELVSYVGNFREVPIDPDQVEHARRLIEDETKPSH